MKLYYSPGACSLADHIAMHEAGLDFERIKVDLKNRVTENGAKFEDINPKGYVPVVEMDNGRVLTENVAILWWVSRQAPALAPKDDADGTRLLEMLTFVSTEIHKQFARLFKPSSDAESAAAKEKLGQRLTLIEKMMEGEYIFGESMSVADAYLFTMLTWANKMGLAIPPRLNGFYERVRERPAVKLAFEHEGLE